MKKVIKIYFLLSLVLVNSSCKNNALSEEEQLKGNISEFAYRIPAGENSWISGNDKQDRQIITKTGIKNWMDSSLFISSYFRTEEAGDLNLGLRLKSASPTRLSINLGETSKEISVNNIEYKDIFIGTFPIGEAGYQELKLYITAVPEAPVEIEEILVGGSAAEGKMSFVEGNSHFGRRGPSVHLKYDYPEQKNILYFYNEIEVPKGEDVIGSFFMANGFSDGYFGMQVNSENERRILFSVWSPYETQDPNEIPEDYRIKLLDKGTEVNAGTFGNEGSGGQSYKVYNWKSDITYKFLLKGEPVEDNYTSYTAYFYTPETGKWELIASFSRPYTQNHLENLHSFLENFVPATGDTSRYGLYKNQWVRDIDDAWIPITDATFTADATARQNHRTDYAGGIKDGVFYMKNCGFFNETTEIGSRFSQTSGGTPPSIDLNSLP